jgi:hypothetical protein
MERFVGITFAELVRNLSNERWVLPTPTWLRLGLDLLDNCFDHNVNAVQRT